MKNKKLLPLLTLAATLAACGSKATESSNETIETTLIEEVAEVTTYKLEPSTFNHELISNGKLAARNMAELWFESAEVIAHIYVKNGDAVKRGDVIAELDKFKLTNKAEQARTSLDKAELELQDVLIGQGYQLSNLADVPPAIMKLASVKSGYEQSEAQYQLACYELEHATLKAPFDGVVANLFSKPYNKASQSECFCTLIDNNNLEVDFTVLESELPLISKGDAVRVNPFATMGVTADGRITEVNPLVDANGMVRVKASVGRQGKLFEGMNVRVSINRAIRDKIVVPKTAVVLRSGKEVVFTLQGGKAMWNYVKTGLENGSSYTIEDEGIKPGDVVITGGNINLAHETPVKVVQP